MRLLSVCILTTGLTLGCMDVQRSDELSIRMPLSTVATTEFGGGKISGAFLAAATEEQRLSGALAHRESALVVSSGTFTVDHTVTMENGEDLGTSLPEELGSGPIPIVGGSTPLFIHSDSDADLGKSLLLKVPLPLAELALGTTKRIAMLYLVRTPLGNKLGVHVIDRDDVEGAIVVYRGASFGWFRVILLNGLVSSFVVDTDHDPAAAVP